MMMALVFRSWATSMRPVISSSAHLLCANRCAALRSGNGDHPRDAFGGLCRGFVLPESQYRPPHSTKPLVRILIPLTIRFDFLPPEICVLLRPRRMLGTAVPEAPVHEDRDLETGESHIRYTTWFLENLVIDSVSKPAPVKFTSQSHFCTGSLLPNLRHASTRLCRRRLNT